MITRSYPWHLPKDHEAMKRLMKDDPNFTDAYDVWFEFATDQIAKFKASGVIVNKVIIDPDEFATYCERNGMQPNIASLFVFSSEKATKQ